MIDPSVFGQLMGALGMRVGKPLTEDANAMYYAILSQELTTEEFQRAMIATFRDHRFATWPAPAEIIARGKAVPETLTAAEAWEALESALRVRMSDKPLIPQLRALGCDELAIATFLAIGGVRRWRATSDFRFDEFRREFLSGYGDLSRLPAPQREHFTRSRLAPAADPVSRLARGNAQPLAHLVRGVSPYSPGDPDAGPV